VTADRFGIGNRVRVLAEVPGGNPRTPRYLRGRTGTVVRTHGVVENPLDHRDPYPPLYTVVFPLPGGHDEILAEIHEEWLEPAD
jgi:nitrile hydratase beta subunit-like protein